MSSRSGALLGAQRPRIRSVPPAAVDFRDGEEAIAFAGGYELVPDEWQGDVVTTWLSRKRDGRLACGRCGLAVPRQNGKNGALEIVELFKMVVLGRKILHTAHEVKTARKAFLRLSGFFENERRWPELAALVKEIRRTNGQEAIVLTNGGSCEFVARSRGSGRGFTVDDLVCDEAQELTDEQLEALLPTISSAPSGDPQLILTGTPPGPTSPGEVFTRTRKSGAAGDDKRLAWHEWSVPGGEVDIHNRVLWAETNPALGGRLSLSVIEDEVAQMSADGFARERLGQWAEVDGTGILNAEAWSDRALPLAEPTAPVVLSVETTLDRSQSVLVAASTGPDEQPQVKVLAHRPGTAWVAKTVLDVARDHPEVGAVVIDGRAQAAGFIAEIQTAVEAEFLPLEVVVTSLSDMAQACANVIDVLNSGEYRHAGDPQLDAAIRGAVKKDAGDGAWVWSRRKGGPTVAPLVAMTLALWQWKRMTESADPMSQIF